MISKHLNNGRTFLIIFTLFLQTFYVFGNGEQKNCTVCDTTGWNPWAIADGSIVKKNVFCCLLPNSDHCICNKGDPYCNAVHVSGCLAIKKPATTVKTTTLPTTLPTTTTTSTIKVTTPASTTRTTLQSTAVTTLKTTLLPTLTSPAKSTTSKATTKTTVSSIPSTGKQSTSTTANARTTGTSSSKPPTTTASVTTTAGNVTARTTGTPSSKPPTTTASVTSTEGNVTAKGRIQGPSGKAESSSSPLPGAIGGVIGVLLLAAVASGVFYFLWKRKKRGRDEKVHPSTPDLNEAETKDAPPMENGAPPSDHRV